jgi:DNA-directed RNA polymerase specialized sigma24 family protein
LLQARNKKAYLFACVRNAVLTEAEGQRRPRALDPELAWFEPSDRDDAAELNLRHRLKSF